MVGPAPLRAAFAAVCLLTPIVLCAQGFTGFHSGHYMEHDRQFALEDSLASAGPRTALRGLLERCAPHSYTDWEHVLTFVYLADTLAEDLQAELQRWDSRYPTAWKADPKFSKGSKVNSGARADILEQWYRAQDWHDILYALADLRLGEPAQAVPRLKRVLRLEHGDKRQRYKEMLSIQGRVLLGEALLALGKLDEAETFLREALKRLPPRQDLSDETLCYEFSPGREQWLLTINAKSLLALLCTQTGRHDEAHRLAMEAFCGHLWDALGSRQIRPLQVYALLRTTSDAGNIYEAVDAFTFAHSGEPSFLRENRYRPYAFEADWLRVLVGSHFSRYQYYAIDVADSLAEQHPAESRLRELQAVVLARAGEERAWDAMRQARTLQPNAFSLAVLEAQLLFGLGRHPEIPPVLAPFLGGDAATARQLVEKEGAAPVIWALTLCAALHRNQVPAPGLPEQQAAMDLALELAGGRDQLDRLRLQQQERMGTEASARGGVALVVQLRDRGALDYDSAAVGVRLMNRLKAAPAALQLLDQMVAQEQDPATRLKFVALRGLQRRVTKTEPESMRADYDEVIAARRLHFLAWNELALVTQPRDESDRLIAKAKEAQFALAAQRSLDRDTVMLARAEWTAKIEAARARYDAGFAAAVAEAQEKLAQKAAALDARRKAYLEELKKLPPTPIPKVSPRSPWASALSAQVRAYEGTYHQRVDRSIGYYSETVGSDGQWRLRWVQF